MTTLISHLLNRTDVVEQSGEGIDTRVLLELTILMLILFVLPLDFYVLNGYTSYCSVLFIVGSGGTGGIGASSEGVFLAPPAIILLALAESLPGAFFFVRIRGPNRYGRIRGLLTGSVVAVFFLAALLPANWFQTFPYPTPFYNEFADVASIYPTLSLVGLIFIPLLFRESSFLKRGNTEQQQRKASAILSTRVASSRVSNGIAWVIALVTFLVPSGFVGQSGVGFSYWSFGSTVATIYSNQYSFTSLTESMTRCVIDPFYEFAIVLVESSVRVLFAKKLILYYRGFGQTRRVLATGVIGESLSMGPSMIAYVFSIGVAPGVLMIPLPFLPILGLLLVILRRRLTTGTVVVIPTGEASQAEVWPLAFQEEGVVSSSEQDAGAPHVKVPIIHVILSRIRNRRPHSHN